MPVHDVAARGFGSSAEEYEKYRPSYPDDAVAWLCEQCGIAGDAPVCDLGAGTGKLTRLLLDRTSALVALEPLAGMIDVLHRELPDVPAARGVAEAMPVRDGSFAAIVGGQAFHWFDLDVAFPQLARALRPGGRIGMVWNGWDTSVEWVREVRDVVANAGASEQWLKGHLDDQWLRDAIERTDAFGDLHSQDFRNVHRATPDAVVERVATSSHLAIKEPAERDAVLAEVRAILDAHLAGQSDIEFPYRVDVYWAERT